MHSNLCPNHFLYSRCPGGSCARFDARESSSQIGSRIESNVSCGSEFGNQWRYPIKWPCRPHKNETEWSRRPWIWRGKTWIFTFVFWFLLPLSWHCLNTEGSDLASQRSDYRQTFTGIFNRGNTESWRSTIKLRYVNGKLVSILWDHCISGKISR